MCLEPVNIVTTNLTFSIKILSKLLSVQFFLIMECVRTTYTQAVAIRIIINLEHGFTWNFLIFQLIVEEIIRRIFCLYVVEHDKISIECDASSYSG